MNDIMFEYLPFIMPLIIAQIGFAIFSAIHVVKHPNYRFGNKMFWMIIVLFVSLIGPALYFVVGRGEE